MASKASGKILQFCSSRRWIIPGAIGLVVALVLLLVPLATVPVQVTQTEFVSEVQQVPVTETVTEKQPYTEQENRTQTVVDTVVFVQANEWSMSASSFAVTNWVDPMLQVSFATLDNLGIRFMVFDKPPIEIYTEIFSPPPVQTANQAAGTISLKPTSKDYFYVFNNYTFVTPRQVKLNVVATWTEDVTKYRDVSRQVTTYKDTVVQVPRQRTTVAYERRSLLSLLLSR